MQTRLLFLYLKKTHISTTSVVDISFVMIYILLPKMTADLNNRTHDPLLCLLLVSSS